MQGYGLPMAPDVQIQALHIVQEALSNVRKHAQASRVQLRAYRHPHWRIEVQDDGVGFVPTDPVPDSLHVGLGIMRERALGIGARVHLKSAPGHGTTVTLELAPSALVRPVLPALRVDSDSPDFPDAPDFPDEPRGHAPH
jgi:two-component system nitrate/nitrite sensor histidine kinase NarX